MGQQLLQGTSCHLGHEICIQQAIMKQSAPENPFSRDLTYMSTKSKLAVLSCSLVLVVIMALGSLHVRASSDGPYPQLQVYSEVLSKVDREYVDAPNIPQVTDGALHGLLEALDPNSSYMSPSEYKAFNCLLYTSPSPRD